MGKWYKLTLYRRWNSRELTSWCRSVFLGSTDSEMESFEQVFWGVVREWGKQHWVEPESELWCSCSLGWPNGGMWKLGCLFREVLNSARGPGFISLQRLVIGWMSPARRVHNPGWSSFLWLRIIAGEGLIYEPSATSTTGSWVNKDLGLRAGIWTVHYVSTMADMKEGSKALVIWKMQIKTSKSYHCMPFILAKYRRKCSAKYWQDYGTWQLLWTAGEKTNIRKVHQQTFLGTFWHYESNSVSHTSNSSTRYTSQEILIQFRKETCMRMFSARLFAVEVGG